VVQIEPSSNTVTVGRRESLERTGLLASRFNWQGRAPEGPSPCLAQIRARHQAVTSFVEPLGEGRVRVVFDVPQQAVTPGQVVTLYQDDLVLGGGWIDRAIDPPSSSSGPTN
jgi:tRNA-specific 2-thiouridylase